MSLVKRAYAGSDVQMLTVLDTMMTSAKEHQPELAKVLSTYTPEYLGALDTKIDTVTASHFGKDAGVDLRKATALLSGMQKEVLNDLGILKTIIESQFRTEPAFLAEVLKNLGFDSHYRAARTLSQEGMVMLLAKFRQHMTADMKSKIIAKGAQPALIERLLAKGNELHDANVNQEVFKDSKRNDIHEYVSQFNELYKEVMDIAKIAAKVFKDKPTLKDKFNYTKHLKALTGAASASTAAKKAKAQKELALN